MKTAFLFPGQGTQYLGMGKDLYKLQSVHNLFEECSDIVKKDLAHLLFYSDETTLMKTENTQIAMMLMSLSAVKVLEEYGVTPNLVAGFSLGEYAALVCAGVVSLKSACELVMCRGKVMEECSIGLNDKYSHEGVVGMTAVMGLHPHLIQKYLQEWNIPNVYLAMYNSPVQAVIAGTQTAREETIKRLTTLELKENEEKMSEKVKRVIPLKVSGPFHTPLMRDARDRFDEQTSHIQFDDPKISIFSNVTGKSVVRGSDVRTLCLEQIVSPVVWISEEQNVAHTHPKKILEVGAGTVLCGLWKTWKKTAHNGKNMVNCQVAGTLETIKTAVEQNN